MKKLLISLSSLGLVGSSVSSTIACEPVQQFPSMSAEITDSVLNQLFTKNNITLFYPDYLHFINGFFEHSDFEGSLTINKTSSPFIEESEDWSVNEREYFDALRQIYNPSIIDNVLDFTGLTFIVENIFIDEINFQETSNSNVLASLSTTMAVTVLKGWKTIGKLLLNVTNSNPLSLFLTNTFLNIWISSILDYQITFSRETDNFIILTNQSAEQVVSELTSRSNQLPGFQLTEAHFAINSDRSGFIFNGYEYLTQIY